MKFLALGLIILSDLAWAEVPQSRHVWIVTEENHSYESVIGNTSMPYFNSLAKRYGLATQYYAEQHNSLSALMWLVAGAPVTSDDSTTTCYNVDNIVRHLLAKGLTWRSYQEDLPYPGYAGVSYLNYARWHNPIIDFADTCVSTQAINSVPFTQMATDILNGDTPNYAYITPSLLHDAHNGSLAAADYWLSQYIPAILAQPEFKPGGDGILFIVWDEAENLAPQDYRCSATITNRCGGRVATLVIGPQVKPHYQSSLRYDHANLLRTICDALELGSCPAAGAVASAMSDFFDDVLIETPFPNSVVASPVHIHATTLNSTPVETVLISVDDVPKYQASGGAVNIELPMTVGHHRVVVQSSDSTGGIHKRGIFVSVQSNAVVVTNPAPGAVVPPLVSISATAAGQSTVSKMQLYVDGISKYQVSANALNTSVSLSAGTHKLMLEAADSSGALTTNQFSVTSATPAVHILSPAPNSTFYAPMIVSAVTVDPIPVVKVQIYVDTQLVYEVSGTGVQAMLAIAAGTHWVVVKGWNSSGASYQRGITVNVVNVPITISAPAVNATVTSPVTIEASASTNSPVQLMQIFVDGTRAYKGSGRLVDTSLALSSGKHYVLVTGSDEWGNSWSNAEYVNVN